MTDLAPYLVTSRTAASRWLYQFPNGYAAAVTLDFHAPFRFEVLTATDDNLAQISADLTTEQVEAKLYEIAALPAPANRRLRGDPMTDPWVAVLRSVDGDDVERTPDEAASYENPAAFHVVVCRESAVEKRPVNNWVSESFNGLPDSDKVAHWFDAHHIRSFDDLRLRFEQAVAMAVGLNEWEAIQ